MDDPGDHNTSYLGSRVGDGFPLTQHTRYFCGIDVVQTPPTYRPQTCQGCWAGL